MTRWPTVSRSRAASARRSGWPNRSSAIRRPSSGIRSCMNCFTAISPRLQRLIEIKLDNDPFIREQLEYVVDGLADVLAPFLPLPGKETRSQQ